MPRIKGVTKGGSLLARLSFWLTRKKIGRVVVPVRIHALHTRLLFGYGQMEMAQEKASGVSERVKILAQVRVATLIGCPF